MNGTIFLFKNRKKKKKEKLNQFVALSVESVALCHTYPVFPWVSYTLEAWTLILHTGSMDTGITHTGSMDTGISHTGTMDTGITHTGTMYTGITHLNQSDPTTLHVGNI